MIKDIHPKAKSILVDSFYWDVYNGGSPFSKNKVSPYFDDFKKWRRKNPSENPVSFLPELSGDFRFDRNSVDSTEIKNHFSVQFDSLFKFISKNSAESSVKQESDLEKSIKNTVYQLFVETDDQIISIGFGQFAIEGIIHPELKILTEKALVRQLYPFVLETIPNSEFRVIRKRQLQIMLQDLKKIE